MKRLLLSLLWLSLSAQPPFTIVSVDHLGPPPYEPESRIYRLEVGQNQGVRLGERLVVRRQGKARPLGHLQVVSIGPQGAGSVFHGADGEWPMKGDFVYREELAALPNWAEVDEELVALPLPPRAGAIAPPREGLILFLAQRADLSPAGRSKIETWVQKWGITGRWVVWVPPSKGLKPALQKQRADALITVLRELGVPQVELRSEVRTHEGPYDPLWILHWD